MNDHEGEKAEDSLASATWSVSALPMVCGAQPGAAVPVGLALEFRDGTFLVEVSRADDAAALVLGPWDEHEVIAIWRSLAAASGLPLLLPGPDGSLQQPYPQLGRLMLGARSERRRLALLSGRRPRFLAKRKSGRLPRRPRIHREREIATGRAT